MKGEKENVDVAQLVECMTEDHEVVSSNLTVHIVVFSDRAKIYR